MADKVTSVAIEFGIKLDEFKKTLRAADAVEQESHKAAISKWISDEKKRTRGAENQAKQRERAERKATAAIDDGKRAMLQQIPVVGSLASGFVGVDKEAMKAAKQIAAIGVGVAAVGASVAAVYKLGQAFMETRAAAEEIREKIFALNQSAALTSETLGALQLAGGAEFLQKFGKAAGEFGKRISESGRGVGALLPYLEAMNIKVRDSRGSLRATNDVFLEFVGKLQQMPPSADRAAAATQAFGRQGRELMAAIGGTELSRYIELTKFFGADVSSEAINATREWQVQTQILNEAIMSTVDRLTVAGLHTVGFSSDISGTVTVFSLLNSELIEFADTLGRPTFYMEQLLNVMQMFGLVDFFGPFDDFGRILYDSVPQVQNFTDALYGIVDGQEAAKSAGEIHEEFLAAYTERLKAAREAASEMTEEQYDLFDSLMLQNDLYTQLGFNAKEAADVSLVAANRRKREAKEERERLQAQREAERAANQEKRERLQATREAERKAAAEKGEEERQAMADLREKARIADYVANTMIDQMFAELEAQEQAQKAANDKRDQDERDRMEKQKQRLDDTFAAASMFSDQAGSLITNVGAMVAAQHGEHSEKYKKTMRDLFAAQKAVAISDIVIAGAVGIANAFKIDPIFGGIMAAVIGANTAVQIATVASESPSFHTGGMIPARGLQPDETPIRALSGEGVVSRRGMAALDALNRGEGMTAAPPVVVYGARVFNDVDADLVRLPGSSVSRAIRSKTRRRIGHRA